MGSPDFIQLLSYRRTHREKNFQNLSRCSASGEPVWIAKLPTSTGDAYIDFEIVGQRVIAWSWSCFRVEMNIETGAIESSIFTKM